MQPSGVNPSGRGPARPGAALPFAVGFLTIVPLSAPPPRGGFPAAGWAFILVGSLIGLAGGATMVLAGALQAPAPLAAVLTLIALTVLTGALHEDGLADLADGLGGRDRAARLAIMRDSRLGSYGTLALILATAAKLAALTALAEADMAALLAGMALAGGLSRGLMPVMARHLPPARPDGLAASLAGNAGSGPGAGAVTLPLVLLLPLLLLPWLAAAAPIAAAAACLAVAGLGRLARASLGGYTGDSLGAAQQLGEITVLTVLAIVL